MEDTRHVFLIPGLFGFAEVGGLRCFAHVRRQLEGALADLELNASIHEVSTTPTASIPKRAVELLEAIANSPAAETGQIHLIGHSAGGLDARMLATPNVSLRTDLDTAEIARRIGTVVTVATPHHGTPLAGYLATPYGRLLAELLTLTTIRALATGELPAAPMLGLGSALAGLDHGVEIEDDAIDNTRAQLLEGLPDELASAARELSQTAGSDHALYDQLSVAGLDLFNAATSDRDTVRYGSVIAAAPQPSLKSLRQTGLGPRAQASHSLFAALNRVVGSATTDEYRGQVNGEQVERLQRAYGSIPQARDNDGVVPSSSQLWGKLIHAIRADHYDVLGYFDAPDAEPPNHGWLASGSGIDPQTFEQLWTDVARFIADDDGEAA